MSDAKTPQPKSERARDEPLRDEDLAQAAGGLIGPMFHPNARLLKASVNRAGALRKKKRLPRNRTDGIVGPAM